MPQPKEIFIKTDRCLGCMSCMIACAVEHSQSKTLFGAIAESQTSKARLYVEWAAPDKKIPLVCRQCEDAPCMYACISGAITRNEEGIVVTNADKCIGCWTCVMVCPYGVIGRNMETSKAYRCDRCPDREIPACVSACPTGALIYETVPEYSKSIRKQASQELAKAEGE
ncbi:MAG: 4Fe-4S dicluster domain-containing protein [Desulfobacteraceae bacterium]|nr:4Fe-4S dicluster domain-containing protein [Desulfobacteraceae bacterium]